MSRRLVLVAFVFVVAAIGTAPADAGPDPFSSFGAGELLGAINSQDFGPPAEWPPASCPTATYLLSTSLTGVMYWDGNPVDPEIVANIPLVPSECETPDIGSGTVASAESPHQLVGFGTGVPPDINPDPSVLDYYAYGTAYGTYQRNGSHLRIDLAATLTLCPQGPNGPNWWSCTSETGPLVLEGDVVPVDIWNGPTFQGHWTFNT